MQLLPMASSPDGLISALYAVLLLRCTAILILPEGGGGGVRYTRGQGTGHTHRDNAVVRHVQPLVLLGDGAAQRQVQVQEAAAGRQPFFFDAAPLVVRHADVRPERGVEPVLGGRGRSAWGRGRRGHAPLRSGGEGPKGAMGPWARECRGEVKTISLTVTEMHNRSHCPNLVFGWH